LSKYNEILAANQNLRAEIDVIRRERVTYEKVRNDMEGELRILSDQTIDQATKHSRMQQAAESMKEKILRLKEKNHMDQTVYITEYEKLQQKYKEDVVSKRKDNRDKTLKSREKLENLDTQLLLKRRLQRIILVNFILIW
jgi:Txe/YoeB family toxin of Txe-Axe toxin-antitoxin module